LNKQKSDVPPV